MIITKTDFTDQRHSYHQPPCFLDPTVKGTVLKELRGQRLGIRELSLVNMGVI